MYAVAVEIRQTPCSSSITDYTIAVATITIAVIIAMIICLYLIYRFSRRKKRRRLKNRILNNRRSLQAQYGVRIVGLDGAIVILSTDAKEHDLTSTTKLLDYFRNSDIRSKLFSTSDKGNLLHSGSYQLDRFRVEASNEKWSAWEKEKQEFQFTAFVGFKLRLVPTLSPESRSIPLAMRGVTVAQLKVFHEKFPGDNSREKVPFTLRLWLLQSSL